MIYEAAVAQDYTVIFLVPFVIISAQNCTHKIWPFGFGNENDGASFDDFIFFEIAGSNDAPDI